MARAFVRYASRLAFCLLASSGLAISASFSLTGSTVLLNDVAYYVPPDVIATISVPKSISKKDGLTPITVVSPSGKGFTEQALSSLVATYKNGDDVFQDGFLQAVYVQSSKSGSLPSKVKDTIVIAASGKKTIPIGPYFVSNTGSLYAAYRLYSDSQGAFSETTIESADGKFSVLPANIPGQALAIAVPSRLYYTKTSQKPLAGVRIGIKDIYDIAGLRTSNGNRAWYHFYPPANTTAVVVQNLIDAGAIVVGKMKTSQFANGETATSDWVDYLSPFNPRGDSYQDPSSSSSGPGAGIAAYEWLDITLGSDTGGSVRGPSQVQGVYGNRPSHGLVELTNVMPLAPELDTPGLLTRDPELWMAAAKALYGNKNVKTTSSFPKKIKTLGFPTSGTTEANALLVDFVSKLSAFLGASVSTFNLTTAWATANPSSPGVVELLNITYPILISKEQIKLVRDPFYKAYAAAHDGRLPFVNPVPLARWGFGENSTATIEEAVANKTQFMNWFNKEVLASSAETCSDSLLLYVGSAASTNYRNVYRSPPSAPVGVSNGRLSVFSEAPDFVVPIGQAAYNSTITKKTEYLPVTVDFMAAKGCDGMIFSLVQGLLKAGIVKKSEAGQSNVIGGQILF